MLFCAFSNVMSLLKLEIAEAMDGNGYARSTDPDKLINVMRLTVYIYLSLLF